MFFMQKLLYDKRPLYTEVKKFRGLKDAVNFGNFINFSIKNGNSHMEHDFLYFVHFWNSLICSPK